MIDNNCVTKCSDEHLSPSQLNNSKNSLNGNCNNSSIHPTCSMTSSTLLEVHKGRPVKLTVKVIVPVKDHPNFNFIGKLLGPKGNSLKWLQEETQTKMAILGKGSMRDKKKEEDLQTSGDPKYHHLKEDLHVEISAFAPPAEAYSRVGHALHQVQRFLVPDYYDDIRQQQLRELGVLSVNRKPSGSYHSTESTDNGEEEKDEDEDDDPIDQEQGIDEQENENENRVSKCNHENNETEIFSSQLTSHGLKLIKDCHQTYHNQHSNHHHHYNPCKPEQHKTHQNYSTQVAHNFHSQQPFPSNHHHYQHHQLKCPNCLPNLLSSSLGAKLKMTKPVPIKYTSSSLSTSTSLDPSSFTCEYEMSTKRCSCPHPFDTENSDETWNTQRTCKTIRNRFQLMPYSKRTRKLYD